MKVCKFGGSSVADSAQIRKVRDILLSDKERSVVVVSAPGKRYKEDEKITDLLYRTAELKEENKDIDETFNKIEKRYLEIAENLALDTEPIKKELDTIKRNILSGKGRAYAASRGEYLSALIISRFLGWNFLDTEGVIVIGDDNKIEDITYTLLSSLIKEGERYVIPGFYGTSLTGDVLTFSRGGSDITGAIVAKAVSADLYENWTDVSGVYSSDPRVVENAHVIDEMSYTLVREFSEVGASVFHEEAIAPCIDKGIPINIRNTNSPSDDGTLIKKTSNKKGVIGVSAKGPLALLTVHRLLLFKDPEIRNKMLDALSSFSIKPLFTIYGTDTVSWYFDDKTQFDEKKLKSHMKEEFWLDECMIKRNSALVGLVGNNLEETAEYVDALSVLKENGIVCSLISFSPRYTTFFIGVDDDKKKEALKLISQKIFG